MGWTRGSEAGPQPITLKARDSVENGGDGVKALAVPDANPHLWTIQHEGCNNVSYIDFCLTVVCSTLRFLRPRLHGDDFVLSLMINHLHLPFTTGEKFLKMELFISAT